MDITFLGHSAFRLKSKAATLVTDPYDSQMLGLKFPKISADIVTVSHPHSDHNATSQIADVKRVVDGPGEYEIMGVSLIGLRSFHDDKQGEEKGKNTIFVYEMDDLRLCHLGDLGHTLKDDEIEEIGTIDVLMVPVGGFFTIDIKRAAEVVRAIEPSIVIPMHYKEMGINEEINSKLASVEDYITESGLQAERMEKLALKKIDIPEEGTKVIVLERRG